MQDPLVAPVFRRSSKCGTSTCVEVAVGDGVRVRDGKHPSGSVLTFEPGSWATFVAGLKGGEFDLQ